MAGGSGRPRRPEAVTDPSDTAAGNPRPPADEVHRRADDNVGPDPDADDGVEPTPDPLGPDDDAPTEIRSSPDDDAPTEIRRRARSRTDEPRLEVAQPQLEMIGELTL